MRPSPQPQRQSAPLIQIQAPRPNQRPAPVLAQPARPQAKVSFLQTPPQPRPAASQSSSSFFSNGLPKPVAKAKKSFWGLRTQSCESAEKLMKKKKSSLF
ncbi:hypothetical protein PtrSN002B_009483 [Pyrenophora tritici-repentis]|nr:hypothetical protein PtrV1_12502 [Pyrenophora tritici-repentis]KAF7445302.1 hypothetical protein A1F99_102880 [Pyrenophora tritici-repentis]KAF7565571.1 hypothetical protein PtrM4_050050 [Pyrenophora tritici-repentis]KAI1527890.1 hypothetical protein PtrSN001A_009238 [Pyrenophora tritici-repentis]KAI1529627.1 hypothetical protein PtrSN001C_008972 [Pyrenophora tritici-repentis]